MIKQRLLGNAYLDGVNIPGQQEVVVWLLDPALVERHTEAYIATSEPVHADVVTAPESIAPAMSLTIEDTFSTANGDLVVTGRVGRGVVSPGDHVTVIGQGVQNTTVVREVKTGMCHGGPAETGLNVALVIDPIEVSPGQLLYRD